MPERRYAHTVNEINGKIYVVGGNYDEGIRLPRTALVYDRASKEWTKIPHYNNNLRAGHSSCVVNGKLYVFGGNDSIKTVATMEMYDPATGQWILKKPMHIDRALAAAVSIGDKIYSMGGIQGKVLNPLWKGLNKLEVYDTKTDTWTILADMPTYRWGLTATAANGKIYVFGGRSEGTPYSSVEEYDPVLNKWTTKAGRMPTARYCLTSCLMDSSIYVIGGWYHSSMGPIYNNVEVYDYDNDKWKNENPLPVYRAALASVVVDEKIYVFGGASTTHPNYGTSEIHEFSNKDIFAFKSSTDKVFARPNVDSVLFRTEIFNYYRHQFTPHLIITCSDSSKTDSIVLYDDGLHGDLLSDDGIYGNYVTPQPNEDFFRLTVSTLDNQANKYFRTLNVSRFTTAGPVVLDSIALMTMENNKFYNAKPYLRNTGHTLTINSASVIVKCNDPWVSSIGGVQLMLPSLLPNVTAGTTNMSAISYTDSLYINKGYFNLRVTILAGGFPYWKDSMRAFTPSTSSCQERLSQINFSLEQNYPNPFNPATTIKYSLPSMSHVTLKIFDLLGREVAILLDELQPAGVHRITWRVGNVSSGVYFYEIRAGNNIERKKMIILR
ncbi:MAG: kelch repeat-containing protein [Syntrophomonadaceae bacterium]